MKIKRNITNRLLIFAIIIYIGIFCSCNSNNSPNNNAFFNAEGSFKQGNYSKSIEIINGISNSGKLSFEEFKLRGLSFNHLHAYDPAINDFKQCLLFKANDEIILINLAKSYLAENKLDSAISYFTFIINADTNNWEATNLRGVCFLKENRLNLATGDFKKCLKLNPNFYMSYNNIGLINENMGKYKEAINYYNLSILKNKTDDKVFYNRGVSYMYLNKPDSALRDYNKALELNSNESIYYLNRGMASYLLKKYNNACNDWQKSSDMNNKEAKRYLVKYCSK